MKEDIAKDKLSFWRDELIQCSQQAGDIIMK